MERRESKKGLKILLRGKIPKISVGFDTSQDIGSIDLLNPENLNRLGIKGEEIEKVDAFFSIPGKHYEEPGVAGPWHLCTGSIGAEVLLNDGRTFGIHEIFYYDENPQQNHYNGLPHWNHERRFVTPSGEERVTEVEYHIIPDSEKIKLTLREEGKPPQAKTVKRP